MKSVQLESEYHKRLKVVSAITEKQIKNLLIEALDLLFKKYEEEIKNGNKK